MKPLNFLKNVFKQPSPLEVVSRELAEAHLYRLEAEGAVEYSKAMLELTINRIERLNERLKEYTP